MKIIAEKIFIISVFLLVASISFYFLLPVRGNLPGLTTFTLTKTAAYMVIITGLIYYNIFFMNFRFKLWQIFFVLFVFIGLISAFFSEMKTEKLKYASGPLIGMTAMFLIIRIFNEKIKTAVIAEKILLASGIISVAAGYIELFGGTYFDGFFGIFRNGSLHWDFKGKLRISGIFCDTNYFSNFLLFFNFFIVALFLSAEKKLKSAVFFLVFTVSFWAMIFTYSRSNIFAFLISIVFFTAFFLLIKLKKNILNKIIFILISVMLIYIGNLSLNSGLKKRMENINVQITENQRVELQKKALKLIKTKVLFGTGFAEYGKKIHNDPEYIFSGINEGGSVNIISPHSLYLGILLASGITGLFAFLLFCIFYFYKLFIAFIKGFTMSFAVLGWFLAFLISGFFGKEMYVIEDAIYFCVIISFGAIYAGRK